MSRNFCKEDYRESIGSYARVEPRTSETEIAGWDRDGKAALLIAQIPISDV